MKGEKAKESKASAEGSTKEFYAAFKAKHGDVLKAMGKVD